MHGSKTFSGAFELVTTNKQPKGLLVGIPYLPCFPVSPLSAAPFHDHVEFDPHMEDHHHPEASLERITADYRALSRKFTANLATCSPSSTILAHTKVRLIRCNLLGVELTGGRRLRNSVAAVH
jgi:hypothetical protein